MSTREPHAEQEQRALEQRALERLEAMSLEQRVQLLKDAGILDDNGNLAPFYRPTGKKAPNRRASADG